jgi:hypothetical protein
VRMRPGLPVILTSVLHVRSRGYRTLSNRLARNRRRRVLAASKREIATLRLLRRSTSPTDFDSHSWRLYRPMCIEVARFQVRSSSAKFLGANLFLYALVLPALFLGAPTISRHSIVIMEIPGLLLGTMALVIIKGTGTTLLRALLGLTAISAMASVSVILWRAAFYRQMIDYSVLDATGIATRGMGTILLVASWWVIACIAAAVIIAIAGWLAEVYALRTRPQVVIFDHLLLLSRLLMGEDTIKNTRSRRQCIVWLGVVVDAIEKGLIPLLKTASSPADDVVRTRLLQCAAAVREKQIWIALPGERTRQDLLEFFMQIVSAIGTGLYDELPMGEVAGVSARGRVKAVGNTLRVIAGAIVPVALAISLQRAGYMPSGAAGVGIFVAASTIAVVSIMTLIDPSFIGRLTNAKDFMTILKDARNI